MKPNHLILHCDSHEATIDQVMDTELPEATPTWEPLHHGEVLKHTVNELDKLGLETGGWGYGLNPSGKKMFAAATIKMKTLSKEEWAFLLGVRNSYDKSMGVGLCFGESVFVCDNMAFHGTNSVVRVHRPGVRDELPGLLREAFGVIPQIVALIKKRMDAYRSMTLEGYAQEALLIECIRRSIIMPAALKTVVAEVDAPSFDYRAEKNSVLTFKGAVTHGLKNHGFPQPNRTIKLQELLDESCNLQEAA